MNLSENNELEYFLPLNVKRSLRFRFASASSQKIYAECCLAGTNAIAAMMAEGLAPPKEWDKGLLARMFDIAAYYRRGTARLLKAPHDYLLYGQSGANEGKLIDHVTPQLYTKQIVEAADARWQHLVRKAEGRQNTTGRVLQYHPQHKMLNSLLKKSNRGSVILGTIAPYADGRGYIFQHANLYDRDSLMNLAQQNLQKALSAKNDSTFWKNFHEVQLMLFNTGALHRGTQACVLMVMGAIMKYAGYELVRPIPEMDHFMDAELLPYQEYVNRGTSHFERPPRKIPYVKPEKVSGEQYGDDFFAAKGLVWQEPYLGIEGDEKKLESYLLREHDLKITVCALVWSDRSLKRIVVFNIMESEDLIEAAENTIEAVGRRRITQECGVQLER